MNNLVTSDRHDQTIDAQINIWQGEENLTNKALYLHRGVDPVASTLPIEEMVELSLAQPF